MVFWTFTKTNKTLSEIPENLFETSNFINLIDEINLHKTNHKNDDVAISSGQMETVLCQFVCHCAVAIIANYCTLECVQVNHLNGLNVG